MFLGLVRLSEGRLSLLALALLTGCAPGAVLSGASDQDQLTREQFAGYLTVMEAVRTLRSNWLHQRSPTALTRSMSPVWIYHDGIRVGGPEVLERLSSAEIEVIEHYDARRASQRWGAEP